MTNHINTIIFDFGGVLIDWNPMNVYREAFNGDEQKARWFLDNICHHEWNAALDGGKDWHQSVEEKVLEFPEYEKYIRMYLEHWEVMLTGPIHETVEVLKKLKESGKYRIYAITNWSEFTFKITYEKYDFLKLFEGIAVSGALKMIKPHPEIYHYTLDKYNIKPEMAVFIDDNKANIQTANSLGINGILYNNTNELISSLKEFGIEV
jgi:2-haloacid dehalogenase